MHEENGVEKGYFHVVSLAYGLKFPFLRFILEVSNEYGIMPSQLASNSWRILSSFYLGCMAMTIVATSRLFRMFYTLKRKEEFYYFYFRGSLWWSIFFPAINIRRRGSFI